MLIYTIYDHPEDYPDDFVVRIWYTEDRDPVPDTKLFLVKKNLDEIRQKLSHMGLTCIPRDPEDPESIVESWF